MKNSLLILCCITYLNASYSQLNFEHNTNLKGSIKSILETSYKTSGDSLNFKKENIISRKNNLTEFDSIGRINKEIEFKSNSDVERIFYYDYLNGNIEQRCMSVSTRDTCYATEIYLYDSINNNYKIKVVGPNNLKYYEIVQHYDSLGNKTEYKHYAVDENEDMIDKWFIMKYDSLNQLITRTSLDLDSVLISMEKYEYDSHGNLSKHYWINEMNQIVVYTTYQYDQNNLLTREIYYSTNNGVNTTSFYYYKYDKKGNWIERKKYVNSTSPIITERDIIYYD